MYENYTRQALPSKTYRELLGSSVCVFNSNNSFIIENILRNDEHSNYTWHNLIDQVSGNLHEPIRQKITANSDDEIANLFKSICAKRNRIIHSFQITDTDHEQRLATKDKENNQFIITEEYLLNFIEENMQLSMMLHNFRGY